MLKKALDKFPPGTSKRWEVVQAYVRTRTVEEILDMVKHGLKAGEMRCFAIQLESGEGRAAWRNGLAQRLQCARIHSALFANCKPARGSCSMQGRRMCGCRQAGSPTLCAMLCAGKVGGVQGDTFVVAKKRQGNLANTAEADSRALAFTDVQVGSRAHWNDAPLAHIML